MSEAQNTATVAEAPKAEAPKVALLAITPAQAQDVAADLASAAKRREGADGTFLQNVCDAVEGLPPMTAAQFTKQLAPSIREALKRKLKGKAETTLASYASRFKTLTLALTCGDATLQPIAGEGYVAYLTRAAEGVAKGKLPDGTPIWPADAQRSGKAAGSGKAAKGAGTPTGGPTGGHVEATAANSGGGGLDVRPALAAALILCHGNAARAQRLVIACESYGSELDKWLSAILSDEDKTKLGKLTSVQGEEAAKRDAATPKANPQTAIAAAMIEAAKPSNASKRGKATATA